MSLIFNIVKGHLPAKFVWLFWVPFLTYIFYVQPWSLIVYFLYQCIPWKMSVITLIHCPIAISRLGSWWDLVTDEIWGFLGQFMIQVIYSICESRNQSWCMGKRISQCSSHSRAVILQKKSASLELYFIIGIL